MRTYKYAKEVSPFLARLENMVYVKHLIGAGVVTLLIGILLLNDVLFGSATLSTNWWIATGVIWMLCTLFFGLMGADREYMAFQGTGKYPPLDKRARTQRSTNGW